MNDLIIIGNGFDLAHGLRTKYPDFILWYMNRSIQNLNSTQSYEDNLIKLTIRDNRRYSFPILNSLKEIKDKADYKPIQINYKNAFLQTLINVQNSKNWIDVESLYYSQLITLYKRLEKANIDNHPSINKEVNKLNEGLRTIKMFLIDYLSTIHINEEIANKHIRELIHSFSNNSKKQCLFLNFNYTKTLELYVKNTSNINYIHGNLDSNEENIIFGYGDEQDIYYERIERINNNEFLKYFKSFGYFKTNNYQSFITFLNADSFDVHILGHSCGLSDRILLNSIFEHRFFRKINIFYHKIDELNNDFFEKTQEISRHFKSNDKGKMRTSIVPFPDSRPLLYINE